MVNAYKQFVESAIQWGLKVRHDEFFVTRVRLTALYTSLSVVFLCAFSYVLYGSLVGRLTESAYETITDPNIRMVVLGKAEGIIENLILLGDSAVLFIVIIVGFFLTKKTLNPIQVTVKKQTRFIADASHELRTPLAVMKTNIEVALRRKELSGHEARTTLVNILDEINVLTALSNDLLSISKERSLKIPFEKIYLPELLEKKISRFKNLAHEKHISLSLSGSAEKSKFIMGNEIMVGQIFYNLIHNAIQYTKNGGSVKVTYSIRQNKYVVNIVDSGMGISEENLKHIFEPFYRASGTGVTSGSGLGLSIVKSHVNIHNGSIDVTSILGKGTTVSVALPIIG